jgi:hypothetical protein
MIQINSLLKNVISLLAYRSSFIKNATMLDLLTSKSWNIQNEQMIYFLDSITNAMVNSFSDFKETVEYINGSIMSLLGVGRVFTYIFNEPKTELLLVSAMGVDVKNDALRKIVQKAIDRGTGARGLRSIMEESLVDIMYELPELDGYEIVITEEVINNGIKPIYIKNSKSA